MPDRQGGLGQQRLSRVPLPRRALLWSHQEGGLYVRGRRSGVGRARIAQSNVAESAANVAEKSRQISGLCEIDLSTGRARAERIGHLKAASPTCQPTPTEAALGGRTAAPGWQSSLTRRA